MIAAGVITGVVSSRISRGHPETTAGRALAGVWGAMGVCLFLLLMSLAFSGRYDSHVFVAIIGAMLAAANGSSAIILRWPMQFACAAVWLAAAITACFSSENETTIAFLAATFFCQIIFGNYAMLLETRRRRQGGPLHV